MMAFSSGPLGPARYRTWKGILGYFSGTLLASFIADGLVMVGLSLVCYLLIIVWAVYDPTYSIHVGYVEGKYD